MTCFFFHHHLSFGMVIATKIDYSESACDSVLLMWELMINYWKEVTGKLKLLVWGYGVKGFCQTEEWHGINLSGPRKNTCFTSDFCSNEPTVPISHWSCTIV